MGARPQHLPVGNPCAICSLPAYRHRVEHKYQGKQGYECTRCGLFAPRHRNRSGRKRVTDKERTTFIGIDGEGIGRRDHRYILLAASTESGDREWFARAKNPELRGLSTVECLDMILELPTRRSKIFSFSFNYDITKMLTDLDDRSLYRLMRPGLPSRKGKFGPKPIEWTSACGKVYRLNMQSTKFVVQNDEKRVVIWDLFKFFQTKFVNALKDWKVGEPALWDRMQAMKDKRANLDKESLVAVTNYCLEECRCMGQLARKLITACEDADLQLKAYYGAGSIGGAMLSKMGIGDKLAPTPPAMKDAVARSFFGGRFEHSVIGAIREPLQGWDISSAYVYQLAFLPCLQHGSWTHTTKRNDIEKAEAQSGALVRYSLGPNPGISSWGPFPFRTSEGSISFPSDSGGGWVWLDEFLAGERIFSSVRFHEAWVYSSNCNCKPFGAIPEYYNLRLKIGKEGPGIVIKLGMNSCYGKLAQSVGNAMFNSWIWAGMITSGCRAQILQLMGLHKDLSNLLMVATDGIITREKIVPPQPLPTKTDMIIDGKCKPLGGWEAKNSEKGVFFARPGIYFPLEPTKEEIASIRARGVGRGVVLEYWKIIVDAWERDGITGIARVPNVSRFCGAKTSISISRDGLSFKYKRADGSESEGSPSYGQWLSRRVSLTFNPLPKRAYVNKDGVTLALRRFPQNLTSAPYRKAVLSECAKEMKAAMQELMEQPDGDFTEYEEGVLDG